MDVLSLVVGAAAGGVLGYLPTRLRRPAPAVTAAPASEPEPEPEPVVVFVERAPEAAPAPPPRLDEPEPPVATPDALELLKERDRRLTADAKLRLVRD